MLKINTETPNPIQTGLCISMWQRWHMSLKGFTHTNVQYTIDLYFFNFSWSANSNLLRHWELGYTKPVAYLYVLWVIFQSQFWLTNFTLSICLIEMVSTTELSWSLSINGKYNRINLITEHNSIPNLYNMIVYDKSS